MTDNNDTSLERMLSVLDLFSEQRLYLGAEDIRDELNVSLTTSYRYLKVLVNAGLLQRGHSAQFTLGPRIVMLDHLILQGDPVLQCSVPYMKELVAQTGLDCVVSALFGAQLLDTHREYGSTPVNLTYGRGRPRPLFLGGAPKVILAGLPPPQLRKLFDQEGAAISAAGLPSDWPGFRRYFGRIRKNGFYFSEGELDPKVAAIAVPIYTSSGTVMAALSLATSLERMTVIDLNKVTPLLQRAAREISVRLN